MQNLQNKSVRVSCNLAGTFDNGWTGQQPAWTVEPDSVKCKPGNNKLTWSLEASNAPAGFTAAFTNPGIVFKPQPPWTGSTPENKNNGTVTADNNYERIAVKTKYPYTAFVTVTPPPGSQFPPKTFSFDPEVENDTGGG